MVNTKPAAKHLDIKDMSFERALKEHCDRLLKQAEARVEKLTFNQAGEPAGTEPFKPQE